MILKSSVSKVAAALCLCLSLLLPAVPVKAGIDEAVAYIRARQTPDGGFCEPGRGDAGQDATTAWCIMALAASGLDPGQVRAGSRSPMDFLATQSGNWRSVTDYERTLLAVVAGGGDPGSFGGTDLVAKVRSFQRSGGNIGDAVNSNAFGILAYRAAGQEIPPGAVQWHKAVQNPDGGWGNSPGSASNPDMTAASIMALRAAGVSVSDPSIGRALAYLRAVQNPDGGFAFQSTSSDASATAWCVQALVAVGEDPAGPAWSKGGKTPWSFLLSMQAPDGHVVWMQGRDMNPLWTTAFAVCALSRKPFPVAVRRPSTPVAGGGGSPQPPVVPQAGTEESAQSRSDLDQEAGSERAALGEAPPETLPEGEAAASLGEGKEDMKCLPAAKAKGGGSSWALRALAALGAVALLCGGIWYFLVRKRRAAI